MIDKLALLLIANDVQIEINFVSFLTKRFIKDIYDLTSINSEKDSILTSSILS